MKKRYRLKSKFRFSIFLILVFTLLSGSFLLASYASSNKSEEYRVITVRKGDTLWSIATEQYNNRDVRKIVYDIKKFNNLSSAFIYEGQEIKLP